MTTESTTTPWVTATISGEMPASIPSALDCTDRNAKISAPKAMPTGWLRPSSATAMPVKPMPTWIVDPKA